MDAGSLKQRTAFPSSVEVSASFPLIPKSRISVPESGPSFAELDRGDSPIPPLPFNPATLMTSKKCGRSMMEKAPAHKPKKSKKSNKSVVQQVIPQRWSWVEITVGLEICMKSTSSIFRWVLSIHAIKFWNLIFNSPHMWNSLQRTMLYDQ